MNIGDILICKVDEDLSRNLMPSSFSLVKGKSYRVNGIFYKKNLFGVEKLTVTFTDGIWIYEFVKEKVDRIFIKQSEERKKKLEKINSYEDKF